MALIGFLYWRRALTPGATRDAGPALRRLSFALGLVLSLVAVSPPLERLGEERLFSAHMLQHVLLGDLAALALVPG